MAASPRDDTPLSGKPVTPGSATPYTTSMDVSEDHQIRHFSLLPMRLKSGIRKTEFVALKQQ